MSDLTSLSQDQRFALKILSESQDNLFLTGGAGTGKSFVIQEYLKTADRAKTTIVASTGAAAILVGGRTFHSFFGIGILEGGLLETVERALSRRQVKKRLQDCKTIIIDEISMIPGQALMAAEWVSRKARGNSTPWGGLRIIAVGDFYQLPPVSRGGTQKDWAFLSETWDQSEFRPVILKEIKRTQDLELANALSEIRLGKISQEVSQYFASKVSADHKNFKGTRLFTRRDSVEGFNETRLAELPGEVKVFETQYTSEDSKNRDKVQKDSPLPIKLRLKKGALVMLRSNDPEGRWVNGSLGTLTHISDETLTIDLFSKKSITLSQFRFEQLDADGKIIGSARNFPINLAYATTIHKAQGMTLDQMRVDLQGAWEHGQAYVALSRAKSGKSIHLSHWNPDSIILDPLVRDFSREIMASSTAEV